MSHEKKSTSTRRLVGAPCESREMSTFSKRSVGTPCELRKWSCSQEGWGPTWVMKNEHFLKKVSRALCESQKISTFSSYVRFFLCHVLSSLSLCRLESVHHDFLSGREIDCHLTFPQGFIFSTGIFLLHIKKIYFRFLSVIWIPQCVKDHRVLIIMTRELKRAAHVKRCKFCFLIRQQISFVRPRRRSGCRQHLETIVTIVI